MNGTARYHRASGAVGGIVVAAILLAGCAPPPRPPPAPIPYSAPVPKPRATTVEEARKFLRGEPSGETALKEAKRYRAAGNREAVFLLVKHAARKQHPLAAYEMGRMYAPATHAKGVVLNPDVRTAAAWFRLAARIDHVPSMLRLGEMYRDGILEATGGTAEIKNGVPRELLEMDATERGFFWLDRAAKAGGTSE